MILKVVLAYQGYLYDIDWPKRREDFPLHVYHDNEVYEQIMFEHKNDGKIDYELSYGRVSLYGSISVPSHTEDNDLKKLVEKYKVFECQCGSKHSSFSWDHMKFCSKWKPWSLLK